MLRRAGRHRYAWEKVMLKVILSDKQNKKGENRDRVKKKLIKNYSQVGLLLL